MEFADPVRCLTESSVPRNTPIWVGKADPGDPRATLGGPSGDQVLIERAYLKRVTEVATAVPRDDVAPFAVHGGPAPRGEA